MDLGPIKIRRTDSKANRRAYTAGVAIIEELKGDKVMLRDAYEASFNVRAPQNPSQILDPQVHRITRKGNSEVSIANPTLVGITETEYQAVVDKCNRKVCA